MRKKTVFFLLLILFSIPVFSTAQEVIKGKVIDKSNMRPIPGITVVLKGTTIRAVSNMNGEYSIPISPKRDTLQFVSVNYELLEVRIQGRRSINVSLTTSTSDLNEIVVVGYGTQLKKDLTGSVASVKIADLEKAPVRSFEEALAGRVAGVQVNAADGQPGSSLNIVVRGVSSLTQETAPLYVIDGFPVENFDNSLLNPADISAIEVLKDASATAIYGARGGNGVVIITTKKGQIGAPKIGYQFYSGFQSDIKRQELMSPFEFVKYQLELAPASKVYTDNDKTLESYRNVKGIDWQEQALQTGQLNSHTLSVNGGTEKTKYYFSGSAFDQEGILINSGYKRYQGRIAVDQQLNGNVKAGIALNISSTRKFGVITNATDDNGSATVNLMYSVWGYRPVSGGDDDMDDLLLEGATDASVGSASESRFNPVFSLRNEYNPMQNNNAMANGYVEYKFLKNFTLRFTGGFTKGWVRQDVFNNQNTRFGSPNTIQGRDQGMNGSIYNTETLNLLNENTLSYSKNIKKHRINAVVGFTLQKNESSFYGFSANQVPNAALGVAGLDEGIPNIVSSVASLNGQQSFLGRVNYNYHSKYFLTASFRADGSSKFADGNKWAYFPSASFAWRIKNEKFFKHPSLNFINDAKLRLGYGMTGNNRVPDFAYRNVLSVSGFGYGFNGTAVPAAYPSVLGNALIKWENSKMANAGVDFSFLKGRIDLTADVYKKNTRDLLFNASLNPSSGFSQGFKNIGEITNQGLELTLNTLNIKGKNFSWQSNFNISFNRNRVIALNQDQAVLLTSTRWSSQYNAATPYIAIPGKPVALFYGYVFDGVFQYQDFNEPSPGSYVLKGGIPTNGNETVQPGDVKYKDINGDGVVNDRDRSIIGDPNASHIGGFSNNFSYRGFDLNVFFQWSYGNEALNANRFEFEGGTGRTNLNQFAVFQNRWTPENQNNEYYRAGGQGPNVYSSRVIEDASYLRLKTVAFGYNLPVDLLSKIKVKQLRVYASAQNLITWTNYSGLDPDVSVRNGALTPGFDWSAYPTARTITFGLNINL